ncbi:MAG: BamA/TamA family outer membrane protein [Xanthomonadales bacterium]|nr:BamA/TamA family outer membrane protein [Xanthomonadales bacterium]
MSAICHEPRSELRPALLLGLLALLYLAAAPCLADTLTIRVAGISSKSMLLDVQNRLNTLAINDPLKLSKNRLQRATEKIEAEAIKGLRPFGYYHATVVSALKQQDEGNWLLELVIKPGPPLRVSASDIQLSGPGAELEELREWRQDWPMPVGKRVNQVSWEVQKNRALELAEGHGYLTAQFVRQQIRADLDSNTAELELELDTGPQAVMGNVSYEQDVVNPEILQALPRFKAGQAYDSWLLEKFRLDLWHTGYFENIEVIEERRLEESPPVVNLVVKASARKPNTYQGTLGFGTDTGIRAQVLWTRRLLSDRGDSLDMGLGWQETNNEFSFRSNYRLPRRHNARQFWTGDFGIRKVNQDLEIQIDQGDQELIKLANGDVTSYSLKGGLLVLRDFEGGYEQINENWYGQYVLENNNYQLLDDIEQQLPGSMSEESLALLRGTGSSMSFGVNWDWPAVRGSGFETVGHHERLWIFTANEIWGSDADFSQAYISSNWNLLLGDRFKLLLRGETGYSNARVVEVNLPLDELTAELSVTRLPDSYRFKAGGSRSVRGYSFESLSNNGIGSNNIITASAELEMLVRPNWAAAAFVDTGNAFNDWNNIELKTGLGLGLRWYTIIGSIRLDIAHPLDIEGDPWRLHFTIGTPLL